MRVLFDNGVPRGLGSALAGHSVEEARSLGWDRLKNGDLLDAAEADGFDVFVTTDRNLRYQQSLVGRRIAVIVLSKGSWPLIRLKVRDVADAVRCADAGSFFEVEI